MAILPKQETTPFDPTLEIEESTLNGELCANVFYVAINEASFLARDSGPGAPRDRVLLATITEQQIKTFPINIGRQKPDYLKPKYRDVTTITFPSDDGFGWPLPCNPHEFEELLADLPAGFSKQFQYGLGLKWEYRFLVDAIGEVPGITELVISEADETTITGSVYTLGVRRYDQMRRGLDNIARRYQREAHEDKRLLAYTNILHSAAAD
jgi:hypothetical protein